MSMKYFITEFQCNADGTVGSLNYAYDDEFSANQKYHEILMYAAMSDVPAHGAVMFTSTGVIIKGEGFDHTVPEPDPEPEPEIEPSTEEVYAIDLENGDLAWANVPEENKSTVDAILRQDVEDGKITAERYTEITGIPYD